ncbi:MAG: endonuclease III [Candidatus Parcubacteria bacterium]|nr:MAG: endonuclease III [Candidatus Parcubacteria bacterium]
MINKQLQQRKKIFKAINKRLKELYPQIKTALNFSNVWELLVAVILSAQTTDKKVNEVTAKLFKKYKTLDDYCKASLSDFQKDIKSINFYKNKAKYILTNAKIIKNNFNGKVPRTMQDMLKLAGVARKTANLVLSIGYNIFEGIAVDTHVKRLAKILHLTNEDKPERIEKDLMEIVPRGPEWRDFNLRLVQYGRDFCPAKKHNHNQCPLTPIVNKIIKA